MAPSGRRVFAVNTTPLGRGIALLTIKRQERRGWSVAQLLRDGYAPLRVRKSVLADRVLAVSLDAIITAPDGLAGFMAGLEAVPGCGGRQRDDIQAALVAEFRVQADIAAGVGDMALAARLANQIAGLPTPPPSMGDWGQMQFHPNVKLDDLCARLWHDRQGKRFIYLPAILPEAAKTAAVMACEGLTDYASKAQAFWAADNDATPSQAQPDGLILIDEQVLAAMHAGCGCYAALGAAAWQEQKRKLTAWQAGLPAGISVMVINFAKARLHPSAVIGSDLVLPMLGGCGVAPNPQWLPDIIARCDLAQADARDLSAMLADWDMVKPAV
jgi:hypothetical protein